MSIKWCRSKKIWSYQRGYRYDQLFLPSFSGEKHKGQHKVLREQALHNQPILQWWYHYVMMTSFRLSYENK